MDLSYSAEDEAYRRTVRDWFDQHKPGPLHTHAERRAWHRKLYDAGFIGMGWPKAYGGWEARPIEQAIVGEEMARRNAPGGVNGLGIGFIGPTLIVHGGRDNIVHPNQADLFGDVPTAEVVVMPESRHFPFLEEADLFNEVLLRFLRQDSPRAMPRLRTRQPSTLG